MFSAILSIAFALHSASAQGTTSSLTNVTKGFLSSQIVPDVIATFNPTALVNVSFTDAVTNKSVDVIPGILLSIEQTAIEPNFFLVPVCVTSPTNPLVLAIVDPDAPDPQFVHFLGGEFTADPMSGQLTNSTPGLVEFFPPAPPAGSAPHRYAVLVFNQPNDFNTIGPTLLNASTLRNNFSISVFAQKTNLGDPFAGNYFLVGPSISNVSASVSLSQTSTLTSISGSTVSPLSASPSMRGTSIITSIPGSTISPPSSSLTTPISTASVAPSATSHGSSNKFYKSIFSTVDAAFCLTITFAFLDGYL